MGDELADLATYKDLLVGIAGAALLLIGAEHYLKRPFCAGTVRHGRLSSALTELRRRSIVAARGLFGSSREATPADEGSGARTSRGKPVTLVGRELAPG